MKFTKEIKMKDFEKQNLTIRISYTDEMTLYAAEDSLHILNQAFSIFYEIEHIPLSESNEISPKVESLSDGSLFVDVIVPISCALLPVLYDVIKNAFASQNKYLVSVDKTRTNWVDEDNYEISKAVLKEYAIKQSHKSVEDFIDTLSLPHIYKKRSIRAKIQNTQQLMMEQNISNTLTIAPLKHYSKTHRIQFDKARKDLHI